jgi:hypothetical protein
MAQLNLVDKGELIFSAADLDGAGEDTFINNGRQKLLVKNDDTADITVIIQAQKECEFGFLHDLEVTVPAGTTTVIDNIYVKHFNDENEKVHINYSATTFISVAVISNH